jgi:chaperone modulatory protein CbpM
VSGEKNPGKPLEGRVLEDTDLVTLTDLCRSCMVKTETITLLVDEGILDPVGDNVERWCFSVASLRRVKTAVHLQRDLGVNLAGAALALDLLDRIAELERL